MTSQDTAHGRFQRAIQRRNLFQAELAMREMGTPSLLAADATASRTSSAIIVHATDSRENLTQDPW
jgi:hypothetical protein